MKVHNTALFDEVPRTPGLVGSAQSSPYLGHLSHCGEAYLYAYFASLTRIHSSQLTTLSRLGGTTGDTATFHLVSCASLLELVLACGLSCNFLSSLLASHGHL